jgi:hypothetical protein
VTKTRRARRRTMTPLQRRLDDLIHDTDSIRRRLRSLKDALGREELDARAFRHQLAASQPFDPAAEAAAKHLRGDL